MLNNELKTENLNCRRDSKSKGGRGSSNVMSDIVRHYRYCMLGGLVGVTTTALGLALLIGPRELHEYKWQKWSEADLKEAAAAKAKVGSEVLRADILKTGIELLQLHLKPEKQVEDSVLHRVASQCGALASQLDGAVLQEYLKTNCRLTSHQVEDAKGVFEDLYRATAIHFVCRATDFDRTQPFYPMKVERGLRVVELLLMVTQGGSEVSRD